MQHLQYCIIATFLHLWFYATTTQASVTGNVSIVRKKVVNYRRLIKTNITTEPRIISEYIAFGTVIFILAIVAIFRWKKREKKRRGYSFDETLKELTNPPDVPDWAESHYHQRDELQFGEELGQGAFGVVIKAKMRINQSMVVVKTGKAGGEGFEELTREGQLMTKLEFHHNIINLLGVSMDFPDQGCRLLLILDFCSKGSLDKILESKKEEMQQDLDLVETEDFNMKLTVTWSYQIAMGMKFLANHKVIHGDLTTRNILVDKDNTAKIADFGMAHRVDYDNIGVDVEGIQPVWWMAPEAIKDHRVTMESDKWSYGVTLWEIFSLGESPYSDRNILATLLADLDDGYRMAQPQKCPKEIYDKTILTCWDGNPNKRPDWSEFIDILHNMVDSQYLQKYNLMQAKERNNYIEIRNSAQINENNGT